MIDRRINLLARAAAGDPDARRAASEALLRGLAIYLRHGGEISLETAIGLPGPTARRRLAQLQRNFHLSEALQLCPGPNRAEQLAQAIRDFSDRIWNAWRDLPAPPAHASRLRASLWRAMKADPNLPTSSRQLRRLLGDPTTVMDVRSTIEDEARIEWAHSPSTQSEFCGNLPAYLAYRRAECAGRVTWTISGPAASPPPPDDSVIETDGARDEPRGSI